MGHLDKRYAKGQRDGAKGPGNYNKPHGLGTQVTSSTPKRDIAQNKAYSAGWRNATKQRK